MHSSCTLWSRHLHRNCRVKAMQYSVQTTVANCEQLTITHHNTKKNWTISNPSSSRRDNNVYHSSKACNILSTVSKRPTSNQTATCSATTISIKDSLTSTTLHPASSHPLPLAFNNPQERSTQVNLVQSQIASYITKQSNLSQ